MASPQSDDSSDDWASQTSEIERQTSEIVLGDYTFAQLTSIRPLIESLMDVAVLTGYNWHEEGGLLHLMFDKAEVGLPEAAEPQQLSPAATETVSINGLGAATMDDAERLVTALLEQRLVEEYTWTDDTLSIGFVRAPKAPSSE